MDYKDFTCFKNLKHQYFNLEQLKFVFFFKTDTDYFIHDIEKKEAIVLQIKFMSLPCCCWNYPKLLIN